MPSPIKISANKLAEFAVADAPEKRRRIVRDLKRQAASQKPYGPYYSTFRGPAKGYLSRGCRGIAGFGSAIARIRERIELAETRQKREWQERDERLTKLAIANLIEMAPAIEDLGVSFLLREDSSRCFIEFGGVKVSVTPDMYIEGERNGIPRIGAMRFFIAKDWPYQLGQRQAVLVNVMGYHWLADKRINGFTGDPSLCMVVECLQQRITRGPEDPTHDLAVIERAAKQLENLWNNDEKAA